MVADLIQTRQSNGQKLIVPFNKDLLVRAIDYFLYSSPRDLTDLQKAVYNMRIDQLEIYEICNLCLLDNNSRQSGELRSCQSSSEGFLH
ncbi:MAG: hypothetical protein VKL42_18500 [Snowella sp.]|nr:hypothetical protein [Snowella sp.]